MAQRWRVSRWSLLLGLVTIFATGCMGRISGSAPGEGSHDGGPARRVDAGRGQDANVAPGEDAGEPIDPPPMDMDADMPPSDLDAGEPVAIDAGVPPEPDAGTANHLDAGAPPRVDAGTPPPTGSTMFAVIGDFGQDNSAEQGVATLVHGWNPEFVVTTGDNNYPDGTAADIDANIGKYYHDFIGHYSGTYGAGSATDRFFPCLGNHDWHASGATPYLDYFTLPGNERYYDFVRGPVHFFAIDSDSSEPDGTSSSSRQGTWLHNALTASTSRWNIVYFHHTPYTSGSHHGSASGMQWPFAAWGADAVLAGHEHVFERVVRDGVVYFTNGVGGATLYSMGTPISGSAYRNDAMFGAQKVTASGTSLRFEYFNSAGSLLDSYEVH